MAYGYAWPQSVNVSIAPEFFDDQNMQNRSYELASQVHTLGVECMARDVDRQ